MVTRKPVGPRLSTSNTPPAPSTKPANPPYPVSPTLESAKSTASTNSVYSPDLSNSPAFDLIDMNEARQRERRDSDASSHGTWDSDTDREDGTPEEAEVPKPLNVRASQIADSEIQKEDEKKQGLPASLRIGPSKPTKPNKLSGTHGYEAEAQANPWAEQNAPRTPSNGPSKNPYLNKQNGLVGDNSQSAWNELQPPAAAPPPPPTSAPPAPPVELPTVQTPADEMSYMSMDDHRPASWATAEILSVPQQGQAPLPPVTSSDPAQESQTIPKDTWWHDDGWASERQEDEGESAFAAPAPPPKAPPELPQYAPPPGPPPTQQSDSLIDHDDAPTKSQRPTPTPITTSQPPASGSSKSGVPETPGTQLRRQKNETYQIKHINWFDASYTQDPRMRSSMRNSPILAQNANGPCPLLALVNALVLSTPNNLDTALIETLRSREQISLGLLLDAVFDELMSGRRGDTAAELPDVSELYSFLLALHTGMNVNPRFVTPAATPRGSLDGHPAAVSKMHPILRSQRKAGAFEETREMRLYSTFSVPLIHGWTAPADTPAYEAFLRSAQTFEDAQNIQFAESELEDKMRSAGLTPQEQQTLEDIKTIRSFLDAWPTQLTDFGLQTIAESLGPGQIAILFRNDHFSTIYKEPKHGALMTLVTDAGYSSHDEIVWESLVDVNGNASEMFSGDFRPVSHAQDVSRLNQGNSAGGQDGWSTVQPRGKGRNSQGPLRVTNGAASAVAPPPLPGPRPGAKDGAASTPEDFSALDVPVTEAQRSASEQEDHDLALALQLQEEEEDQQRQTEQRRRREQELSEQFLSTESSASEGPRPPVPPRRSGGRSGGGPTTAPSGRAPVTRASDRPNDPEAPPSYEQAASDRPYRPAGATAAATLSQGNPLGAYDALRRQQSAYAQQSTATVNTQGPNSPPYSAAHNRRRSEGNRITRRSSQLSPGGLGGPSMPGGFVNQAQNAPGRVNGAAGVKDADERCAIM